MEFPPFMFTEAFVYRPWILVVVDDLINWKLTDDKDDAIYEPEADGPCLHNTNIRPLSNVRLSVGIVEPKSKYPVDPFPWTYPAACVTVPLNVPLDPLIIPIALGAAIPQIGKNIRFN